MKKILLILVVVLIFACLIFIVFPLNYQLRISLKLENFSSAEIDLKLADEIQKELLNISEIKDFVIFSNDNECNIYCRFWLFGFFRKSFLNVENRIFSIAKKFENIKIEIDEEFDKKYTHLLLVSSDRADYWSLEKFCDELIENLYFGKNRFKIKPLYKKQLTAEIIYDETDLKNYDLTVSKIKELIANTNIVENYSVDFDFLKNSYTKAKFEYKKIDDIKKNPIYFLDKKNSLLFSDIFEIKSGIKPDDSYIFYNNNKTYIYAIKTNIFNIFFLNLILKNFIKNHSKVFNVKLINLATYYRHEYFWDEISQAKIMEKYNEIYKNNVIFLINAPMVNKKFFEKEQSIIMLDKKYVRNKEYYKTICDDSLEKLYLRRNEYLKNDYNSFGLKKRKISTFEPNLILLNEYQIPLKEVMDSIYSNTSGLYCGSYYDDSFEIKMYLKNRNHSQNFFLYSSHFKNLVPSSIFLKSGLKNDYVQIVRKNGKYCIFLRKTQNPS